MKIWIVSDGEPLPSDNSKVRLRRMGNLANILNQRGHEILWFSSNFDHYNKKFRSSNNDEVKKITNKYNILLLATKGYKKNISFQRLIHFKLIAKKFKHYSDKLSKPDIIISTLAPIEVSKVVKKFSKQNGVPIIIDIRDLWPDIYYEVTPKITHIFIKLLVTKTKRDLFKILNKDTIITGVTSKFMEYGLEIGKRNKNSSDRVFHTAYPSNHLLEAKNSFENHWDKYNLKKDDFIVTFVGNFGKQFELDTVFKSIDKLKDRNIKFVLCGTGDNLEYYQKYTKNNENVILPGWINKEEIGSLLTNSDIGIAPYINSKNFRLNCPNKFGEYLASKLPILVSVDGIMNELLIENNCGFLYKNSNDLTSKIINYYSNPILLNEHKNNSYNLYKRHFDVETVYNQFADFIEKSKMK